MAADGGFADLGSKWWRVDLWRTWNRRGSMVRTRGGRVGSTAGPQLQAVPFTLNAVGAASLLVHVPWKPKFWLPFAGIVPL